MKILFVAGANTNKIGMPPFIKSQGESIDKSGVNVVYYPIIGKGVIGYLSNIRKLRTFIKSNNIDLIHAHYTLAAWVCVLAMPKQKIILSLMGTDAYGTYISKNKIKFFSRYLTILTILIQPFVSKIISKSKNIEKYVWLKRKSIIIPNGVNIDRFVPSYSKNKDSVKKILFLGDKKNPRKNFNLVETSLSFLNYNNLQIITPYPIKHCEIPKYLNDADILVFPSFMEGSPNVIKEAMACNLPIVATNVGDIAWLFGDEAGHYISDFTPKDFSNKIQLAIEFSNKYGRTYGRKRIKQLNLESDAIARKIINIYKSLV